MPGERHYDNATNEFWCECGKLHRFGRARVRRCRRCPRIHIRDTEAGSYVPDFDALDKMRAWRERHTPRHAPKGLFPHGTNRGYVYGCRCARCANAGREYMRNWRAERSTQNGKAAKRKGEIRVPQEVLDEARRFPLDI